VHVFACGTTIAQIVVALTPAQQVRAPTNDMFLIRAQSKPLAAALRPNKAKEMLGDMVNIRMQSNDGSNSMEQLGPLSGRTAQQR
jgi:hypothetical protein